MASIKFNARWIETLKPPATGRLQFADEACPGLGFKITAKGERRWLVRYRPKGQPQRETIIGVHPDMSLADARARANAIRGAAKQGRDLPAEEASERQEAAREARRPRTLGDLLDRYVEDIATRQRRPELVVRMLATHVPAKLRGRPLVEVRRGDFVELFDDLQRKGLTTQVNRLQAQLKAAMAWAVEREFMDANPLAGAKKPVREAPRDRILSDAEMRKVWATAVAIGYPGGALVQMMALTGQRRDEVREMRWSEIDGDGVWTIPAERMKTRRSHEVPLPPAVVEWLATLPRVEGTDFVFTTGRADKPYAGQKRLKEIVDRESGVTDWDFHDLRRTLRSGLSAFGIGPDIGERVLGHAFGGKLDAVYNRHDYRTQKRDALARWSTFLMTPNVVPLRRPAGQSGA